MPPPHPPPLAPAETSLHFSGQGAIAQLGERLDRTQEVGGSSPPSSTRKRLLAAVLSPGPPTAAGRPCRVYPLLWLDGPPYSPSRLTSGRSLFSVKTLAPSEGFILAPLDRQASLGDNRQASLGDRARRLFGGKASRARRFERRARLLTPDPANPHQPSCVKVGISRLSTGRGSQARVARRTPVDERPCPSDKRLRSISSDLGATRSDSTVVIG